MRIIFHYPADIFYNQNISGFSGSSIRPQKMLQAFCELGCVVDTVWGQASERKAQISEIKKNVNNGMKYDFIYSESSTMPTLLTEPSHLPVSPTLDFGLLGWAKKNGVPVGLYYRDIHWRFEQYKKQVSWYKRWIAIPFYHLDLFLYHRVVDQLFLPNLAMLNELPEAWIGDQVHELPPGGDLCEEGSRSAKSITRKIPPLNLLYVGGVRPPLYNLSLVFDGLAGFSPKQVQLTLCCREREWQNCNTHYIVPKTQTLHIIHEHGDALKQHYFNSDVALLLFEPFPYWNFALPLKLFESICYAVPVVAPVGTAVGEFVQREGVGWVIKPDAESFQRWLIYVLEHPDELEEKRKIVRGRAVHHTWQERAKEVIRTLTGRLI